VYATVWLEISSAHYAACQYERLPKIFATHVVVVVAAAAAVKGEPEVIQVEMSV
jgi:hypothetical protein